MKKILLFLFLALTLCFFCACGNHQMYYDDPAYQEETEQPQDEPKDSDGDETSNDESSSDDTATTQEEEPVEEYTPQTESSDNDLAEQYGY